MRMSHEPYPGCYAKVNTFKRHFVLTSKEKKVIVYRWIAKPIYVILEQNSSLPEGTCCSVYWVFIQHIPACVSLLKKALHRKLSQS